MSLSALKRYIRLPYTLRARGVLGMNGRNASFVQRYNKREFYPRADSKLLAKEIAVHAGIPVPELYAVLPSVGHFEKAFAQLENKESFVIKPEHGSGGEGVLVLTRAEDSSLVRSSGEVVPADKLRMHIADIVSGLYSLGGQPDVAMIESKVEFDTVFESITYRGVPDVRIIVLLGVPALAMLRLPTKQSGGRANLHQGAVGVGIDIATGITRNGVLGSQPVSIHPDTGSEIAGVQIPHWDRMLEIACKSCELFKLNYLGIDLVLDRNRGPLMLEVNVRPGLAVQLANRIGLFHRLKLIEKNHKELTSVEARMRFAREKVAALR